MTFTDFEMQSIAGDQVAFSQFQDKVSLVVNVASA
jgi:glutathione peroxidase-family protein